MTYQTLQIREVGSERIVLARAGDRFRVVSAPRTPPAAVEPIRRVEAWDFRTAEVALRAFRFVVATERAWDARFRGAVCDELRSEARETSLAFRRAALVHRDPATLARALDLLARLG